MWLIPFAAMLAAGETCTSVADENRTNVAGENCTHGGSPEEAAGRQACIHALLGSRGRSGNLVSPVLRWRRENRMEEAGVTEALPR